MSNDKSGYWTLSNLSPSTVDWCEKNYVISYYMAEFFNSVSSFSLIIVGLLGLYLHRRMEKRILIEFFLIAVIGIGSFSFHATLLKPLQALDELPMVYCSLAWTYCIVENEKKRKYGYWFPIVLLTYAIAMTFFIVFSVGGIQYHTFRAGFTIISLYVVYSMYKLSTFHVQAYYFWKRGTILLGVAWALWIFDLEFCEYLEHHLPFNPQFHSWWHILASAGVYTQGVVIAFNRATILKESPEIKQIWGILPYIASKPKSQ